MTDWDFNYEERKWVRIIRFAGVITHSSIGTWKSEVLYETGRVVLGTFISPESAKDAIDQWERKAIG